MLIKDNMKSILVVLLMAIGLSFAAARHTEPSVIKQDQVYVASSIDIDATVITAAVESTDGVIVNLIAIENSKEGEVIPKWTDARFVNEISEGYIRVIFHPPAELATFYLI